VLISHTHRFIFVHIQKTAGQSLKRALMPYCSQPQRTGLRRLLSHLPIPENPRTVAFRAHTTARWARLKISPRVFDSYCRFAVVRNPFDRAVSNYHFLQQSPRHHNHVDVKALSFDGYLDFLKRRRWFRDPTQVARVEGPHGRLLCDPILRFESLDADFAALCRRLGLNGIQELPKRNASRHEPYREYYLGAATRSKLVEIFAQDFDAFGYDTVP
jgi:hypothetical protein